MLGLKKRLGMGTSLSLSLGDDTLNKGGGASAYASAPAPTGYRWAFVTENGYRVTDGGVPVVDLVRAA